MTKSLLSLVAMMTLSSCVTTIKLKPEYTNSSPEKKTAILAENLPKPIYNSDTGAGDQYGLVGGLVALAMEGIIDAVSLISTRRWRK